VALKVKEQILATGHTRHACRGVTAQELSQGLGESFGLKKPAGALVGSVQHDSAAAAAGLQLGDVITEINGEAIEHSGDLSSRISQRKPGDTVKLSI
jgi:serine protease Do